MARIPNEPLTKLQKAYVNDIDGRSPLIGARHLPGMSTTRLCSIRVLRIIMDMLLFRNHLIVHKVSVNP